MLEMFEKRESDIFCCKRGLDIFCCKRGSDIFCRKRGMLCAKKIFQDVMFVTEGKG